MTICLFGTYLRSYSRNITFIEGLKRNKIKYIEVHKNPLMEQFDRPQDLTLKSIFKKIRYNLDLYGFFLKSSDKVKSADVLLVLYPGHLILPIAWLIGKLNNKKVVFDSFISLYDSLVIDKKVFSKKSYKAKFLLRFESLLLKMPDKILADTNLMRKFLIKQFNIPPEKVVSIPIGSNDTLYKPSDKTFGNEIVVLFFGYYNPLQGAIYIVQAAKILKNNKKIKFLMIGDGVTRSEVQDFVNDNNLENVSFLPLLPEEKLVHSIQAADIMLGIFSQSSIAQRVIPNKVYAAIACRKPLISAKLPSIEEYFYNDKNIIYCEPENPKSLAGAIKNLATDSKKSKRIAEGGYETFLKYFSPNSIGENLIQNLSF